jgi:hypothetical protein
MRKICVLALAGALAAYSQLLKTQDISPDGSDYVSSGGNFPGGRIMSLAIDPNDDHILYAAGEFGGIWKSTTGLTPGSTTPMKWFHSSKGLRNGLTQNQYSLAVDQADSKRLLYATGDDDGRPLKNTAHPGGGLWISLDRADHWKHRKLCPFGDDGVTSVAFSTGQPFVVTACGIWTSTSSTMSSWTLVKNGPYGGGTYLVDGGKTTLLACSGNQVYRTNDLGSTPWAVLTLKGTCYALAAVPSSTASTTQVQVVRSNGTTKDNQTIPEVTLVDFKPSTQQDLGFSGAAGLSGSGVFAIATAPNPSLPNLTPIPGGNYDLYVADACAWYEYSQQAPHWIIVGATGKPCVSGSTSIHVDTWAMVFSSWYNPAKGQCPSYVATDGGVFFNYGFPGLPAKFPCAYGPWAPVQNGLHALEATVVTAITGGSAKYAGATTLPLAIYLPTGDNDAFVQNVADCPGTLGPEFCTFLKTKWHNLNILGDAGQALVDPPFPNQALLSRNNNYVALTDPPSVGGKTTQMIPSLPTNEGFDNGYQGAGTGGLTQIMTMPSEVPVFEADYLAVQDFDTTCKSNVEMVVRNINNPPNASAWVDLSPGDHFLACDLAKIQAGGGHSGGLNVYVLTTRYWNANFTPGRGVGQIYRGVFNQAANQILSWTPASGPADNPAQQLGQADNFFVNPYEPKELYAVDILTPAIKVSRDSGATWQTDSTLTDIATNHGEYVIGCNGGRGDGSASDPFANGCSISWIAFPFFHSNIRVAAAGYGGIAFSRDNGHHWMALDVTDNNHFTSPELTERVSGVFFDGETPLPGLAASDQVIYAGLKGQSLIRVEGPFLSLEALNFVYQPTSSTVKSVEIGVLPLDVTVKLRKDTGGIFRGRVLFDSNVNKSVIYSLQVDGKVISLNSYTLTAADIQNGVATAAAP